MCLTCSRQIFENLDGFFCDTEPIKSRHSFPVSEEQTLSNEWLPAKIVIGSSLKPLKVVKNVWKKCQTKWLPKTLSSDHFIYHFQSLHSLQSNFNDRWQTNQGVIEHPALPMCWTSDVWQSDMMPLPHSRWSHRRSEAAAKTRGKVQFNPDLRRQNLT